MTLAAVPAAALAAWGRGAAPPPAVVLDVEWTHPAAVGARGAAKPAAAGGAAPAKTGAPPAHKPVAPRTRAAVFAVTGVAPGQAGYVHYFHLTRPDGELEVQIGIELPDQRIAWAFPEIGVSVSPFVKAGTVRTALGAYAVEHLYGIRPFPEREAMQALQREIAARVAPWMDYGVPHCDPEARADPPCVSCLGFVLRILFPGAAPGDFPRLPADFRAAVAGRYSTEDLLYYLAGMHAPRTQAARVRRLDELTVPEAMREELARLVAAHDPGAAAAQALAQRKPAVKGRGVRAAARAAPRHGAPGKL